MMNKIIFTIFLFALFTALNATDIFACSCSLPIENKSIDEQVKEAYKNSTAVFSGEVLEVIKNPDAYFVEVKFKVVKSWKNEFKDSVLVRTGQGGGDCGYEFEIGKKYLIYTNGDENNLRTNICTRTSSFESSEDVDSLNKIKKIKKPKIKSSPK